MTFSCHFTFFAKKDEDYGTNNIDLKNKPSNLLSIFIKELFPTVI